MDSSNFRQDRDFSLELSGGDFRRMVEAALDHLVPHIDQLAEQPAWDLEGAEARARDMMEPLPESPVPLETLLNDLFQKFIPVSYNTAGPGYLAYVPGGGLLHSAVADLIADAVNRYVGVWTASPALAQMETTVVRWFCDLIGFPPTAGGYLTTGGSMAIWSALVTARAHVSQVPLTELRLYTSSQAHHCVTKAAALLGLQEPQVRHVEVDSQFRMCPDALRARIAEDRARGCYPWVLVATAGTTNCGAVDPLSDLSRICREEQLWMHVDATYGGFFALTERGRKLLQGMQAADSVALDPHKSLFLPYGNGCLLVRELAHLRRAHQSQADYMPAMQECPEFVDLCEISPELSRDFRALRIWLPLKLHGRQPFAANLDEKLDLAQWATAELEALNSRIRGKIEIVARPQLSTVAFRYANGCQDEATLAEVNERLRVAINARKRVMVTPTRLDGKYVIRICVLSFRTHLPHVQACLEDLESAIVELERGLGGS